ncbi:MAG: M50 family metallopeptidase [Acutalibacteraceae bacterium]|nr:M50 family metallopeptidase [Acutalibacteraceae bacterium]
MKRKKNKISYILKNILPIILFLFTGVVCGSFVFEYIDSKNLVSDNFEESLLMLAVVFIGIYLSMSLHTIIHEAGHLVFGLLTGYKFSSFRIGSFMWLKEDNKIRFYKYSLAGTSGQCLMSPPDTNNGKHPFVLYNLGGSIMNIIFSVIFIGLLFLCTNISWLSVLFGELAIIGIAIALMNGVPMKLAEVNNDGYNTLSIAKNKKALDSFYIQMKINEQITKGMRTKDMPEEWFEMPCDEDLNNCIVSTIAVLTCCRMIYKMDFEKAYAMIQELLNKDAEIVGINRNILILECIYCELIGEKRTDVINSYIDTSLKKFIKLMKNNPSVLRIKYAYSLLLEQDENKAQLILKRFEKVAKTYPHNSEIEEERELIEYARKTFEIQKEISENKVLS